MVSVTYSRPRPKRHLIPKRPTVISPTAPSQLSLVRGFRPMLTGVRSSENGNGDGLPQHILKHQRPVRLAVTKDRLDAFA